MYGPREKLTQQTPRLTVRSLGAIILPVLEYYKYVQLTGGVVDESVRREVHRHVISCVEEIHQSLLAFVRVQLRHQQQQRSCMRGSLTRRFYTQGWRSA